MSSKEIYVSTDVEADAPIPGPNSMLSFGSAAYTGGKELIGTFSANRETLPGATADPKTAEWGEPRSAPWFAPLSQSCVQENRRLKLKDEGGSAIYDPSEPQ